jgi:hypothetical protein
MPESASLPDLSRRRLLLAGAAIPVGAVLAATASHPGADPRASTAAARPAWPAPGSAADFSRIQFCFC